MNVTLELDREFLLSENIFLGPEDLRFGLEHGYLTPVTAIDLATDETSRGADDPLLQDIASLLHDEQEQLSNLLSKLDDPERIHDPRESVRKWLFLELDAAYSLRSLLNDPLGFVEEIYSNSPIHKE